jgi:ribosomal protein S6
MLLQSSICRVKLVELMDESEKDLNTAYSEIDDQESSEKKVYEAGFHIVPTMATEDVRAEFEAVKKMIQANGGELISEGEPQLRNLAYTLSKTVKAVKSNYDKAYFGWLKFETFPHQIGQIKKALDEMPTIIRHLIVITVRENTMVGKADAAADMDETAADEIKEEAEGTPSGTLEDLDKTIDELVVQ